MGQREPVDQGGKDERGGKEDGDLHLRPLGKEDREASYKSH